MAQADYIISNQTFPNTRADINSHLQAIATNNSGTSAPTTQYAGQFWIDTTSSTWTLYIHDGSDDIQFATIDTSANTVNFTDSALDVVTDTSPQLGGNLDLNSNDITGTGNINITGTIESSGNITGTLATASQPNITSVGTLTSFTSTGIDDNADSTTITIDSNENVGIGTASPTNFGSGFKTLEVKNASGDAAELVSGTGVIAQTIASNTNSLVYMGSRSNNSLVLTTNDTERIRIGSSGNVVIGTTTTTNGQLRLHGGKESTTDSNLLISNGAGSAVFASFTNFGVTTVFGSITKSGSGVAYNTTSDYRAKENVSYNFDATTRLKQLRPARFNFIGETDRTVDGFLAHEVSNVVPEAISGTHNETETKEKVVVNVNGKVIAENIEQADWEAGKIADENGNTQYPTDSTWEATKVVPVYQGIDQAKLVPLLVKTIQELEARITALETQP